jgi:hypothetical protein
LFRVRIRVVTVNVGLRFRIRVSFKVDKNNVLIIVADIRTGQLFVYMLQVYIMIPKCSNVTKWTLQSNVNSK